MADDMRAHVEAALSNRVWTDDRGIRVLNESQAIAAILPLIAEAEAKYAAALVLLDDESRWGGAVSPTYAAQVIRDEVGGQPGSRERGADWSADMRQRVVQAWCTQSPTAGEATLRRAEQIADVVLPLIAEALGGERL